MPAILPPVYQQWRGPLSVPISGNTVSIEAKNSYSGLKDSEVLALIDSGYTSLAESRAASTNVSRLGSRVSSQRNSRASSPIRSSRGNSRVSSRATSPVRQINRRQPYGIVEEESVKPRNAENPQTFVVTMPNGRSMPLDQRSAANVLKNVMDDEVDAAREWLDNLDWESASRYERMQYQCFMMEEEYRRVYDQGTPDPDFDQKTFEELVIADTIISMIEKAWPESDAIEEDAVELIANPSPVRPRSEPTLSNRQVNTMANHSSGGHHRKKGVKSKTVNRCLKFDESVSSEDDPKNLSDSSISVGAKPMQVHRRSSKPKREDAVFNIRYKTQPCMHYQKHRKCPAGDNCHFAHGPDELRRAHQHPKFKTQPCVHFSKTGECPFGEACFFLHDTSE